MATYDLLQTQSGPTTALNDTDAVTLGMEFTVSVACNATLLHYWQPTNGASSATRTGAIFLAAGSADPLIRADITPSGNGWQTIQLASPLSLNANTVYVVAFYHPAGCYAATSGYFDGAGSSPGSNGISNGPLAASNDTNSVIAQGCFIYGSALNRPTQGYGHANYWVDVTISHDDAAAAVVKSWRVSVGGVWKPAYAVVGKNGVWVPAADQS